jgi:predicted metalloprotease
MDRVWQPLPRPRPSARAVALVVVATAFLAASAVGAAAATGTSPDAAAAQVAEHRPALDRYWRQIVARAGVRYRSPRGVYWYSQPMLTPCGPLPPGGAYCPQSRSIYLPWRDVTDPTALALAPAVVVVLAHEWGHHVQQLLGWSRYAENRRLFAEEEQQADCYAGMYIRFARAADAIGEGDVERAVALLAASGDPHRTSQEAGSHGSGEERARWFRIGLAHGDLRACNAVVFGKRPARLAPRRGR